MASLGHYEDASTWMGKFQKNGCCFVSVWRDSGAPNVIHQTIVFCIHCRNGRFEKKNALNVFIFEYSFEAFWSKYSFVYMYVVNRRNSNIVISGSQWIYIYRLLVCNQAAIRFFASGGVGLCYQDQLRSIEIKIWICNYIIYPYIC